MSVILFTRNLYWTFGDYPTLIVVPSFIICAVWYFLKSKKKELGLTVPTLFYALLCIPLFAFDFHGSPRKYFPDDWNDRLGEVTYEFVELPYEFRLPRVEALNDSAFSLKNIGRQEDAIQLYREAIELEPDNPKLYFGLSQSLARNNELESAIKALNMAIENDDTFSVFYSNRGLYYYKLKQAANAISDLETAIQLDSTTYWPYANLALVYAQINELEKACAFITLAEEKGMAINSEPEIKRIDEGYCKRKNR
jgi:tetratricopeptide (TPR) repeat protein